MYFVNLKGIYLLVVATDRMGQKKKKKVYYILSAIIILAVGLFFLNLHLTKRLERYLQKELILRTTAATDGFYKLSFDSLSISLFKGELKIKGIRLVPDSIVFKKWADIDSLPQNYVSARIGLIDFKGVNLTWRVSYKKLHFNSFEIIAPDIQIYDSYNSSRTEKNTKFTESKTLYEIIAPYINVLSVKTLNLENASVSYTVENPVTPIIYALTNVSFHAYDFLLDKNSSQSGKLLYCDNFDFVTNQSQILLTNNDFSLITDSIRLSTEDSIIFIKKINLSPQKRSVPDKNQTPANYLDALVETVKVQGIQIRREDALNYLTARSFDIFSSDIKVFKSGNNNQFANQESDTNISHDTTNIMSADSLIRSLSLYDIISPVLHSVSIRFIGIANTRLQYSIAVKDTVEVYKLNNLNFQATDFLVDSLSEDKNGLWYSKSIAFEATGIVGVLAAHNHRFSVKRMTLDTQTGNFNIEKVRLAPLSTRTPHDYLAGSIDTIGIRGLFYDKGISAGLFKIDHPDIRYFMPSSDKKKNTPANTRANNLVDVEGILNPLLQYLSVKKISLTNAYFTLNDRSTTNPVIYKLNNFNYYATDVRVDETTSKNNDLFFNYGNMGFSFSNFDNYLPGKKYKLSVRNGQFSTSKGLLRLQDVKLIPQNDSLTKIPETSVTFSTPLIYAGGFHRIPKNPAKNLHIASFGISSPHIKLTRTYGATYDVKLKELALNNISWDSTHLLLGSIHVENPVAAIRPGHFMQDSTTKNQVIQIPADLYNKLGSISNQITLEKFNLTNANINYAYYSKSDSLHYQKLDTTNLSVAGLIIDNVNRSFKLDDIRFSTRNLEFPLDNNFYTLQIGSVNLNKTSLALNHLHLVPLYPKMEFSYIQPKHKSWFDVSVGSVLLTDIDLPTYFSDKILHIKKMQVDDVLLQNFKNQKIALPKRVIPMIYSGLQKAPIKLDIKDIEVNNLAVIYEELAKKGTIPGKLYFTDMNGRFSGFTNIVTVPDQYIRLDANGKLMGQGDFTATWQLPVDSLNDCFLLNAELTNFDLTMLNQLITPLAPAEVQSGHLKNLTFSTVASSKGATIDMLFLYNDLKATLLKEKNGETTNNKLLSRLANLVLKHNNPDKSDKMHNNPRHSHVTIERNPYHSTFNYLWQILRPALVESVGISKKKQDTANGFMKFISKVKNFFRKGKDNTEKQSAVIDMPNDTDLESDSIFLDFETINKE